MMITYSKLYYLYILQISGTCVDPDLSDKEHYPRFFRTASSDTDMIYTRLEILKLFGWKRIALFHGPEGPFAAVSINSNLKYLNLNISVSVDPFKS